MAAALPPCIRLPRGWPAWAKTALLHTIGLARMALVSAQTGFENSRLPRAHRAAEGNRLREQIALRDEEYRILRARMERVPPAQRPHYSPSERLAILELRARAGWTAAETADQMLLTPRTVTAWMQRLDEQGPDALGELALPSNRYPDYVAVIVQELRQVQPELGKSRTALMLARSGLHLSRTTVGRMRMRPVRKTPPTEPAEAGELEQPAKPDEATKPEPDTKPEAKLTVEARYPRHLWHADLILAPVLRRWVSWWSFSLMQASLVQAWYLRILLSLKTQILHLLAPPAIRLCVMRRAVTVHMLRCDQHRSRTASGARTPADVCVGLMGASDRPWLAPCARLPLPRGHPAWMVRPVRGKLESVVEHLAGRPQLPTIVLRHAA